MKYCVLLDGLRRIAHLRIRSKLVRKGEEAWHACRKGFHDTLHFAICILEGAAWGQAFPNGYLSIPMLYAMLQ